MRRSLTHITLQALLASALLLPDGGLRAPAAASPQFMAGPPAVGSGWAAPEARGETEAPVSVPVDGSSVARAAEATAPATRDEPAVTATTAMPPTAPAATPPAATPPAATPMGPPTDTSSAVPQVAAAPAATPAGATAHPADEPADPEREEGEDAVTTASEIQ